VLDAGLKLLQEDRADLFYLTLSDFIQHKHAPGSAESNEFLRKLDDRLRRFEAAGAIVAVTADHGMSAKTGEDGKPNVLFVEDFLTSKWPGAGARVICPIADPFVKHHGALGGFVRVHLTKSNDQVDEMIRACRHLPQVETALSGEEAACRYDMPLEREGDLVVISKSNAVLGAKRRDHDLSQLGEHHLRSHGGLSEQAVPLFMSVPRKCGADTAAHELRNLDIFELVLNQTD
jgi:phosphonoacetate hydrolase